MYNTKIELIKLEIQGEIRLVREQSLKKIYSHFLSLSFTKSYICLYEPKMKEIHLYLV